MRRHDEGWWKFKAQSCQPEDCCIPLGSFVFCDLFCSVFIHWLVRFRHKKDFVRCKTKWLCYNMPLHNSSPAHKQGTWHSMWHRVVLNKHWYVRNTRLIIAMIGATLTALTNLTLAALDTMGMRTGWPQPCFTTQLQQPSRDNRCHYEKSGKQFKDAQSFEFHPNPISGVHCFLGNRQTNDWLIQHWQPSK